MQLLTWEPQHSVGVQELDEQHKKIFAIINRLYDVMQTTDEKKNLGEILEEMRDYCDQHFSLEEKYFDLFHYEDRESHEAQHRFFREKSREFIQTYAVDGVTLSFDVLDFLEDWWFKHINNVDKKYTKCFQEHGLQ